MGQNALALSGPPLPPPRGLGIKIVDINNTRRANIIDINNIYIYTYIYIYINIFVYILYIHIYYWYKGPLPAVPAAPPPFPFTILRARAAPRPKDLLRAAPPANIHIPTYCTNKIYTYIGINIIDRHQLIIPIGYTN